MGVHLIYLHTNRRLKMKLYRTICLMFIPVCFSLFIVGCLNSVHSDSNLLIKHQKTDIDTYNEYKKVAKKDLDIRDKIGLLVNLSYFGYKSHPEEALSYIKTAMMHSNRIDHDHAYIGELFILYAKLNRLLNENYRPVPILEKAERVLGNRIKKELKKSNPYKRYFKKLDDHEMYVFQVNIGKEYMRNADYDVGKDKKISVFYKIGRAITLQACITRAYIGWKYALRDGDVTFIPDIYYYDFIAHYLNLAIDGYDIIQMPDHRLNRNTFEKDGKTYSIF